MCPNGLKQELYDQVCLLREKRLDLGELFFIFFHFLAFYIFIFIFKEELHAEEKKILEQLKKDQDSMNKKSKLADNSLKLARQELENFQVNFLTEQSY
jgi:hypothetical protein